MANKEKMSSLPLFSVVVLHYNQPEYWREAVLSVLRQDYPAMELVFQDDASTTFVREDVEVFIEEHKQENLQHYVVQSNSKNAGTAENCDNGVAACTGKYVLFLDGDDALAGDDVVSKFVAVFAELPDSENVVTANCQICDKDMVVQKNFRTAEECKELNTLTARQQYEMLYTNFFPVPSCTAFRRKIFKDCGGFKVPDIFFCQDGYYYCHIARMGNKFHVADFLASKHRDGGIASNRTHSLSPNQILLVIEFLHIGEKEYFPYLDTFTDEKRDAVIARYYDNLSAYRMAKSGGLDYGIPEPAYTMLCDWTIRSKIVDKFVKRNFRYWVVFAWKKGKEKIKKALRRV